jgi:hypothetical protein
MARYRIISEAGAYLARSAEIGRLELGGGDSAGARAYNVRAPVCELLVQGTEVDMPAGFVPGPHLEPLDDAARADMAAYWKARPGASLDPTRSLPLGRDPLATQTLEGAVMAQLERLAADAVSKPAVPASDAKLDALLEAVTKMIGVVSAAPDKRKAA